MKLKYYVCQNKNKCIRKLFLIVKHSSKMYVLHSFQISRTILMVGCGNLFYRKFFYEGKKSTEAYFKGSCGNSCAILLISARRKTERWGKLVVFNSRKLLTLKFGNSTKNFNGIPGILK